MEVITSTSGSESWNEPGSFAFLLALVALGAALLALDDARQVVHRLVELVVADRAHLVLELEEEISGEELRRSSARLGDRLEAEAPVGHCVVPRVAESHNVGV